MSLLFCSAAFADADSNAAHPRLYFNKEELAQLRELRAEPGHAAIWKNIQISAEWCLTKEPRKKWIAPVTPDPVYENLYDRFFGIMQDLAITEHLSFAYALSGDEKYGEAARQWVLASCRVWQNEANGKPDDGKAYAVMRMLKGVAVGYDLVYDRFTEAERKEIRETMRRIAELYFEKYYSDPTISGPNFCTHHAVVQWTPLGVVGLTLLGEAPEAQKWVDATTAKFERDILPRGLAPDGAQVEGATFWASTMHYRIFYMDALRRVTGRDLFKKFAAQMNADLALASVVSRHVEGYTQNNQDVVLEPYYGQLDYYSPDLLFMAREYRRPIYQYLASWDTTMGQMEKTRAITPHGEQLLFSFGGYDYVWYDPSVPAKVSEAKLSYHFPSVDEAYVRCSWKPDDLLVGVRKGQLVVHAGGMPILMEGELSAKAPAEPPKDLHVQKLDDTGDRATIRCGDQSNGVEIEMNRVSRKVRIRKSTSAKWQWYTDALPVQEGKVLKWANHAVMHVLKGEVVTVQPDGYAPELATGFNKLKLADPAARKFTVIVLKPTDQHEIELEVEQ